MSKVKFIFVLNFVNISATNNKAINILNNEMAYKNNRSCHRSGTFLPEMVGTDQVLP